MAAGGLDAGGESLGRQDERRELVVLVRVALEERAAPDVVEICREHRRSDIDRRSAGTARADEGLGDPPYDPTVRHQPLRIAVSREVGLRGCGQVRQLSIDTTQGPAYGRPPEGSGGGAGER